MEVVRFGWMRGSQEWRREPGAGCVEARKWVRGGTGEKVRKQRTV